MERDIKRAKGADELPIATMKETVIRESTIEHWEAEIAARDATIDRLTKEVRLSVANSELGSIQTVCGLLSLLAIRRLAFFERQSFAPQANLLH